MQTERSELKSALETLKELRHGECVTDLTVALLDLVTAVQASGGKGSVTLTVKVQPFSKADSHTLMLTDEIKGKPPKVDRGATILFSDDHGELSRNDPRQPLLPELRQATVHPLREVIEKETASAE